MGLSFQNKAVGPRATVAGRILLRNAYSMTPWQAASIEDALTFEQKQGDEVKTTRAFRRVGDHLEVPKYFTRIPPGYQPDYVAPDHGGFTHFVQTHPRPAQVGVIQRMQLMEGDFGLHLPCGAGKSYLSLAAAAWAPGRILVCAPTEVKLEEWKKEIQAHLGYNEVGHVQAATQKWRECPAVVTMLKTLAMKELPPEFYNSFSTVIYDEAHLSSAPIMSQALGRVNGRQVYLTATPGTGLRKKLLDLHMGGRWLASELPAASVTAYFISVKVPQYLNGKPWRWQRMRVGKTERYNRVFAKMVQQSVQTGRRTLALAAYIEPLQVAYIENKDLDPGFVVGVASLNMLKDAITENWPGMSWPKAAQAYIRHVKASCNPILATGLTKTQPGGMGMDVPDLDGGVLHLPVGNMDMTQQIVGRYQRLHPDKKPPIIAVLVPQLQKAEEAAQSMIVRMQQLDVEVRFGDHIL